MSTSLALLPVLSYIPSVQTLPSYSRSILVSSSSLHPGSSKCSFFRSPHQKCICIFLLPHIMCYGHLIHNLINNWCGVQMMKFLIIQFSPVSYYFFSLNPDVFMSILFSNTLNLCFGLNMRDQVSYLYKTGKIVVIHIFLYSAAPV